MVPEERLVGADAHFVYLELGPQGESDVHRHPGDELALVLEGEVEVWFHDTGVRLTLGTGQTIHFHAEQEHSVVNRAASEARLFILRC